MKWKLIESLDGLYFVSDTGLFKSKRTNKLVKPQIGHNGYLRLKVMIKGKRYCKKAHRLVAIAFIPNPQNKPQINHIDGNKENNCVSNLEWCDHQENYEHAERNGLNFHKKRPVALLCNGVEVARFESIRKAKREMGNNYGSPTQDAYRTNKRPKKYKWVFL